MKIGARFRSSVMTCWQLSGKSKCVSPIGAPTAPYRWSCRYAMLRSTLTLTPALFAFATMFQPVTSTFTQPPRLGATLGAMNGYGWPLMAHPDRQIRA